MRGFIPPTKEEILESAKSGYIAGMRGGYLGATTINPSGKWEISLYEPQKRKFETSSCTQFATLKAISTLESAKFKEERNYSERAIAIKSGNSITGNSPHKVAETIRNFGLVDEKTLPFTDELESWLEYMKPNPLPREIRNEAKKWNRKYDLHHEWVFTGGDPKHKHNKIKEYLEYGTICVSVKAWKEKNDIFYKEIGERDNHWTMVSHIDSEGFYHIHDSYLNDGTPIKRLDPNYDFQFAKVYYLDLHKETFWEKLFNLWFKQKNSI
jgi:hypothetical protein